MEKAVAAKAKAALRPASYIRKMDQRCHRGNRPAHTTTAKTQGPSMKDACTDEPKEKSSAPQCTEAVSSKKKKKWQQNKKNANAAEPIGGSENANRNSKKCKRGPEKDLSYITCFNCDQKGHYQKNQKPQEEERTLCIMQANVGRGGSANDLALALASKERIDILLIQKLWIGTDLERKLSKNHRDYQADASEE